MEKERERTGEGISYMGMGLGFRCTSNREFGFPSELLYSRHN